MIFLSMTGTLSAARGDEQVLPLMSEPDARFVFSCTRAHVLREDDLAPCELTWGTDASTVVDYVSAEQVPADLWSFWETFRDIIAAADAEGRVWWGLGRGNEQETGAMYGFEDLPRYQYRWNTHLVRERLTADGHDVYQRSFAGAR